MPMGFISGLHYKIKGYPQPLRFEYENQSTGEFIFLKYPEGQLLTFYSEALEGAEYAVHST
jgi:hypothetical protein